MKYLKSYENSSYNWKNIYEKNGKLYINLYSLSNEMEKSVFGKDKYIIAEKEVEYYKLVKKLMIDKVITFSCTDCIEDKHTGICENIDFEGGFEEDNDHAFQLEFIKIKLEGSEDFHNIDDDLVIIHTDIDPKLYRETEKYNL